MLNRTTPVYVVAVMLACAVTSALGEENHLVTLRRDVSVPMRDGVALHADIYQPDEPGKYPVLLQRTPYNKDLRADFGLRAARRGYVVVIEDVRGRFASGGEWYPFKHESDDGYDTVEWAAALPSSSGKVGMFGESYVGATQVLAAIAHPPHLAGIAPSDTPSNYHDGWVYQGGAFEQGFNQSWVSILAANTVSRSLEHASALSKGLSVLPLTSYPLVDSAAVPSLAEGAEKIAPYYLDWLAHPNFDAYWQRWSIEDHYADIQVPVLTMTAWYDIFLGGALRNFEGIRAHAGSEAARRNQHLIITIAGHAGSGRKIGDLDFGPAADEYDEDSITLSWYDYLLKGVQNHWATDKPVRIFVMGTKQWRQEDQWPITGVQNRQYFLHSGGRANTARGNGFLSADSPAHLSGTVSPSDTYIYDPANPVPTTGGPLCCDSVNLPAGPRDQRPVEQRADVLVYTTPPFSKDTEVTGPVSLDLYVSSTAQDTDFTAKLVDVWPNGYAQNLTEGIIRARYRDSQSNPTLLITGKSYKLKIDLWAISNVFLAGHRIRLEVSSSNFPRFDRNQNTGQSPAGSTLAVRATNTVLHDADHPSALTLPFVEK